MPNHFVISDTHFDHANILTFMRRNPLCRNGGTFACPRPCDKHPNLHVRDFPSVTEMNETMITNWNRVVRPNDHIYHLGDVTMCRGNNAPNVESLLRRLNGHKRLILGNHDQMTIKWYMQWFEKIKASNVIDGLLFTHYPVHPDSIGKHKANVHGHIHNNVSYPRPYINVSVEAVNYTPVALEDLQAQIRKWA